MKLDKITGSRNSDGNVPNVNWNADNRKVYVNWYNSDNANDNLRSRSEVSHKKEFLNSFCVKTMDIKNSKMVGGGAWREEFI